MKHLMVIAFISVACIKSSAQGYWDKMPAFPTICYLEKDDFENRIQILKTELKGKIEEDKLKNSQIANNMTQEQKMALAMTYQKMKPEEIIKMQNEQLEIAELLSNHQKMAAEYEKQFNELEMKFKNEQGNKLDAIQAEYVKLPSGEGTPMWAIRKAKELNDQYNKEYEGICARYFIESNALFKVWLNDYKKFLIDKEIPVMQRMRNTECRKYGITPDDSIPSIEAVEKYINKCSLIFGLRKSHAQG